MLKEDWSTTKYPRYAFVGTNGVGLQNLFNMAELTIGKDMTNVILSAISAGTFYNPQRIDGIECSREAFEHYANKTLSVEILSIGTVTKAGRTTKVGTTTLGTEFDTFRCLVALKAGEAEQIKVRLHLCDLLPLMAEKEAKLSFGTYYPDGQKTEEERAKADKRYLVPTCNIRYSAEQIKESLTSNKIAGLVLNS